MSTETARDWWDRHDEADRLVGMAAKLREDVVLVPGKVWYGSTADDCTAGGFWCHQTYFTDTQAKELRDFLVRLFPAEG